MTKSLNSLFVVRSLFRATLLACASPGDTADTQAGRHAGKEDGCRRVMSDVFVYWIKGPFGIEQKES